MPSLSQILSSKTLLFSFLLMMASIIQILVPFFPPAYIGFAGAVTSIIVTVLRFVTTMPLTDK